MRALLVCLPYFVAQLVSGVSFAQCLLPLGDLNESGATDVVDVQCAILEAIAHAEMGAGCAAPHRSADVTCSNTSDVADVLMIVQVSLGAPLDPALDADGDGCPDACSTNCCQPHAGTGCDAPGCQECVCLADPLCCELGWDHICAWDRTDECRDVCECMHSQPIDCCRVHDEEGGCGSFTTGEFVACKVNIARTQASCWDRYDAVCVATANSYFDKYPCGCTSEFHIYPIGECSLPHFGSGCNVPECEACVCGSMPSCCDYIWNEGCVSMTNSPACAETCGVQAPNPSTACCSAHPGGACEEAACSECVLSVRPSCALDWEKGCAWVAKGFCASSCACAEAATYADHGCCNTALALGCDDLACRHCVCQPNPYCCNVEWDKSCEMTAKNYCAASCACSGAPGTGL